MNKLDLIAAGFYLASFSTVVQADDLDEKYRSSVLEQLRTISLKIKSLSDSQLPTVQPTDKSLQPFAIYEGSKQIDDIREELSSLKEEIEKPVYGLWDDRVNYYDAMPKYQTASLSVAILIANGAIIPEEKTGYFSLVDKRAGLCDGERFRNEPAVGNCTGFRVGTDLIATAGHCIKTQEQCDNLSFIFGFRYDSATARPNRSIQTSRLYRCKSIERGAYNKQNSDDWRIVKVDRPIGDDVTVAKINSKGDVGVTANVTLIGHPLGLPLKITKNGVVMKRSDKVFVSDIDAFGGNSGSPVFSTDSIEAGTPVVEGVLVSGEDDWVSTSPCLKTKFCRVGDKCTGESATYSSVLTKSSR